MKNGPFKGMFYPVFNSYCSALLPKLLGTYESELHPAVEQLSRQSLPIVVDIGCAEGYYAVGFATRIPMASVIAYDTSYEAQSLCRAVAKANGVSDRVSVRGECTAASLLSHDFSNGGLVVSDCEGYEKELFNDEVARHLSKAHLIIEIHDFVERGIFKSIQEVFTKTHDVQIVHSIRDRQKAREYHSEWVSDHDFPLKLVAFYEGRREIMPWALMTPKQ